MWRNLFAKGERRVAFPAPRLVVALLLAGAWYPASFISAASAQTPSARVWESERVNVPTVSVTVNKSRTINIVDPFATALVGSSDIADVVPMSDHSLYIQGKKIGTTNLSIFKADNKDRPFRVIPLEVTPDIENLHEKIVSSTGAAASGFQPAMARSYSAVRCRTP